MANEITATARLEVSNGNHKEVFDYGALKFDQTTVGAHSAIVTVGTSEEDLAVGDIGTLGWIAMRNLDATNYVTYGAKDTTMKALGRIEAGETHVLRLEPGITLRWQANTASVKVKIMLLED